MTDPFDSSADAAFGALYEPVVPVPPDPAFAARLRERLTRAVLDQPDQGDAMAVQVTRREAAWPSAVTPYIVVDDARGALDWYVAVLGAQPRGELYVNDDGTIGHAEVGIGDGVLMFAEASDLWPDVPVQAPERGRKFSQSLHLDVPDVDDTVARARRQGATVEREPGDQPYGRVAVIVDPFGHRWLLNTPPPHATRLRQGDVARVTMVTPDPARAKTFYEAVLEVAFTPGRVPGAWGTEETRPPVGMWNPGDTQPHTQPQTQPETQLCYRVDDMTAALDRVRTAGGTAQDATREPYGLLAECADDQGVRFQLWQPPQ